MRFSGRTVDFSRRELRRDGKEQTVEPKVFDLLRYLVKHRDRVVGKAELLDALWPDLDASEASLASAIVRLRRVLGDTQGRFIKTHYGKGYRFVAECEVYAGELEDGAASVQPVGPGTSLPAIGRDAELERLTQRWRGARAGKGGVVLVRGEQGIGKSRLLEEFRARLGAAGGLSLLGRCYEGESAPPFWPWTQVLREHVARGEVSTSRRLLARYGAMLGGLVPELVPARREASPRVSGLEGSEARLQLFQGLRAYWRDAAEATPLVLFFEDIHWADAPSVLLIRALAQDLDVTRLLLVASLRDREEPSRELSELITYVSALPETEVVELRGLAGEEVARMLAALTPALASPELGERLARETRGNPFFIEQILCHLEESREIQSFLSGRSGWQGLSLPAALQVVIERRLAGLGHGARHLLAIAATIGEELSAALLNRVRAAERGQSPAHSSEEMQAELAELLAAHVLEPPSFESDAYRFTHGLLREVAYRIQGVGERARRHRRVAEALEAELAGGVNVSLAELAEHGVLGAPSGGVGKALEWVTGAAAAAMQQLGFESAAQRYRQALDLLGLLEPYDHAQEADLLVALAQAQWSCGEVEAARRTAEQATALARVQHLVEVPARAVLACGSRIMAQASMDESFIAWLEEARRMLPREDSTLRARLLGRLAWAYYYASDRGATRQALSLDALEMARRLKDPEALLWALYERHRALMCPEHRDERLAVTDELLALAERQRASEFLILGYQQRAWALLEAAERAAADETMAKVGELTDGMHNTLRWTFLLWQGMSASVEGNWAEAESLRQQAAGLGQRIDASLALLTTGTQWITEQFVLGANPAILEQVRGLAAAYPRLSLTHAALAYLSLRRGEVEAARQEAERCVGKGVETLPWDTTWLPTVGFLGMVYAELGDRPRREEIFAALSPYAERVAILGLNASTCYGSPARPLAALAAALGKEAKAAELFELAITTHRRIRARPWLAYTLYEYAAWLRRRGRKRDTLRIEKLEAEGAGLARDPGIASAILVARQAAAKGKSA